MKTLVGLVNKDFDTVLDKSKGKDMRSSSAAAGSSSSSSPDKALNKQVGKLLRSLEQSPGSRRLVTSGLSVLRYYAAHEPDTHPLLTTPDGVRVIWDAMQAHPSENDILEDGLNILMHLTKSSKDRAMVRESLPVYGLQLLQSFKARVDRGSSGYLDSLSRRLTTIA